MYGQRALPASCFYILAQLPLRTKRYPYRLKNGQGRRVSLLVDYTGMWPHGACYRGLIVRSHGDAVGGDEASCNVFLAPGACQRFLLRRW